MTPVDRPDDAPEWTDEQLARAELAVGGTVIREAKGTLMTSENGANLISKITGRREAAPDLGERNAPQTKAPQEPPRRLPDVQTS